MMAEEGHELEGKAPCAQRPTLKIKSKIQSLECRARVSQKSMGESRQQDQSSRISNRGWTSTHTQHNDFSQKKFSK
jgi:hypothetical protein